MKKHLICALFFGIGSFQLRAEVYTTPEDDSTMLHDDEVSDIFPDDDSDLDDATFETNEEDDISIESASKNHKKKKPKPVSCEQRTIDTCDPNGGTCAWNGKSCVKGGWSCFNGCPFSKDGVCDDGAEGSETYLCPRGSDCADCGERP